MSKKIILLVVFLLLPLNVFAKTYTLNDASIFIYDSEWNVFTRDNIKDNDKLNEHNISHTDIENYMNENDIYLEALTDDFYSNKSNQKVLMVSMTKVKNMNNLHVYSEEDINYIGEKLTEQLETQSYDIYSSNNYKYIHIPYDYQDDTGIYNVDAYYTFINGYRYSIEIHKNTDLTSADKNELKKIVDSVQFKYNINYEKEKHIIKEEDNSLLLYLLALVFMLLINLIASDNIKRIFRFNNALTIFIASIISAFSFTIISRNAADLLLYLSTEIIFIPFNLLYIKSRERRKKYDKIVDSKKDNKKS